MITIFTIKITTQTSWLLIQLMKNIQDALDDNVVRDLYVVKLLWQTLVKNLCNSRGLQNNSPVTSIEA